MNHVSSLSDLCDVFFESVHLFISQHSLYITEVIQIG